MAHTFHLSKATLGPKNTTEAELANIELDWVE